VKALVFVVCLVLSLPNFLVGLALLVVQRTFSADDILDFVLYFLQSINWGVPIASGVVLILFIAGLIAVARPFAALCALLLNVGALAAVLYRMGLPPDLSTGVWFLPALLAVGGFVWITLDLRRVAAESHRR
jgi:hypothetical protein